MITRALTNPDRQLVSASQTVAEGDLTRDVEVKTGDEVATEMTSKIIRDKGVFRAGALNPNSKSQIPATLVETSTLFAPAMNPFYC